MKQTEIIACMLIAAAVIGAIAYTFHVNATLETFGNNGRRLMFRGSYPSAPVVCLAGDKHIPCTAFSAA